MPNLTPTDITKVIHKHKRGHTPADIARDLHLGPGGADAVRAVLKAKGFINAKAAFTPLTLKLPTGASNVLPLPRSTGALIARMRLQP